MNDRQAQQETQIWRKQGTFPKDSKEWLCAEVAMSARRDMAAAVLPIIEKIQAGLHLISGDEPREGDDSGLRGISEEAQELAVMMHIIHDESVKRLAVLERQYKAAQARVGHRTPSRISSDKRTVQSKLAL